MSEDKVVNEPDSPKNLIVLVTVIVSVVALVVILVGVREYFEFSMRDQIATELAQANPQRIALEKFEADRGFAACPPGQSCEKPGYHWVDEAHGVVRIPPERAMALTIRDWNNPPAPPPAAPAPAGTAPAAPTTPAGPVNPTVQPTPAGPAK